MANKEIISTTITGVSLERLEKWVVVIASKCSTPNKLHGLYKPIIWPELNDLRGKGVRLSISEKTIKECFEESMCVNAPQPTE